MTRGVKRQPRSRKKPLSERAERERFIAAARELGCADELPANFDDIARKLAAMPHMSNEEVKKRAKRRKKRDG